MGPYDLSICRVSAGLIGALAVLGFGGGIVWLVLFWGLGDWFVNSREIGSTLMQ